MKSNGLNLPPYVDPVLQQAMEAAFAGFKPHGEAVSVSRVREMVRTTYPKCLTSDDVLNKRIGDHAIIHGYNVHFDGPYGFKTMPRSDRVSATNDKGRRERGDGSAPPAVERGQAYLSPR